MYRREPRAEFDIVMARDFGRQPETLIDLTPAELDAYVNSARLIRNEAAKHARNKP